MTQAQHPVRALTVANWFLEQSWQEPSKPPCDQMKLYKLAYYAHGWYLGIADDELYPEPVEAWPHGPIVRDLYMAFKDFGRDPVTQPGKRLALMDDGTPGFVIPKHDGTLDQFFKKIWGVYGNKTGIQLSNMTHRPEEPWTIVAEQYGYDLKDKPIIPNEIIRACFARRIKST